MSVELQKGLVAHIPLDEESLQSATVFADKTPYENVGTSANTPNFTTDRMGQSNRAMSFNGTSDYVDCGDDTSLNFGTGSFSISAWVSTGQTGATKFILGKADGIAAAASKGYVLYLGDSGTNWKFGAWDGLVNKTIDGGAAVINEVVNLVCVYNNATEIAYVYRDGVLINQSSNASLGDIDVANDLYIGKIAASEHNGSIADVRIYNRAISTDEITQLYNSYRPKLSAGSLQKGLVLDMPLTSGYTKDETAGSEVMTDRTPYSNDGQNTGGDVDTDHTTFISANSDYVRIPDSDSLSPTVAMTAVVWVKGAGQDSKGVFSHLDSGTNQRAFLFLSNNVSPYNDIRVILSDDGTTSAGHRKDYSSSIPALDSTWHLIGFTFDAGTLKLYVDGIEDTNPTKTVDDAITTIHNSTADVTTGCWLQSDAPIGFINADLAKARIYNRALTADEMLLWFEQTRGFFL